MPSEAPEDTLNVEIKKIVLRLQVGDRRTKKTNLESLQKILNDASFTNDQLRNFFTETHLYTLNCFRDNAEGVREQAIKFMSFLLIEKLPINDFYLTYVFPVIVERVGTPELVEESEELRLELVNLLRSIIQKYTNTEQLKPFLNDSVLILQECVKDKHPQVKEVSCECIIDLAQALPRDFHMQAESLAKPIITCFGHQRFKVRVKAINALGEVILNSQYAVLNDSVGPLAERLFDQIPVVRRTVAQVAARLLTEYRDRYSFFHKLLPLLLTGLNDEVEETREQAQILWQQVGKQYEQENEKDLKDQLDFCLKRPDYYPVNLRRPSVGCRSLVERNTSKLTKALAYELTSWQADIRVRCSQLLCSLVLHAEQNITQNLHDLLPAMYSAARDEDPRIVVNVLEAAKYMGLFVPPKTWSQLILPVIDESVNFGQVLVLASFIEGCPKEYLTDVLLEIANTLADDDVCVTRKPKLQNALVKCVKTIALKYIFQEKTHKDLGFDLFKIILTVYSIRDNENQESINLQELLEILRKSLNLEEDYSLWKKYTGSMLEHLQKTSEATLWTTVTTQACIFETIILHSQKAFGDNLELIKNLLVEALESHTDPEMRLKLFYALTEAFEAKSVIFQRNDELVAKFLSDLIIEVFVPSLVWHAGLTAEALRTMAVSCLLSALTVAPSENLNLFPDPANLKVLLEKLWPLMISNLEDASFRTRLITSECVVVLKKYACLKNVWILEDFLRVYPEFLKRLDDPNDKVRFKVLHLLGELFDQVPEDFKAENFKAHHEFMMDTLMIHFDDVDETVRNCVFEAVKIVAKINQQNVEARVQRHKPLVRNREGCDEILAFLATLKISD